MTERRLPQAVELLWGRTEPGRRGPKASFEVGDIVGAAVVIADADGLAAVSMARVAKELGLTTMALYRYVPSKDVLLQLMWNAGAAEISTIEFVGDDWRSRVRSWTLAQREGLDRHAWMVDLPFSGPPLAPNSLIFLEKGLQALDGTGLGADERLGILGLLSAYALADARLTREMGQATAAAAEEGMALEFGAALRELVDVERFPRLHELAWSGWADTPPEMSAVELFAYDVNLVLDGVAARIAARADQSS